MEAIPPKAVINRFPQVGGNRTTEASEVIFVPNQGDEGVEIPPPMTPYKPPSVHQSPPFFQKILANKQMFRQRVKHNHEWLRSSIHLKTKEFP